jgi:DNA/RNA endonuclease YhcR with UshA esterase domain
MVSHLHGTTLTITDSTGTDFTVTLTAQTQIIETVSTNAAALKAGQILTVTGRATSQGGIQASLVAILLNLPTRLATPTATP